MSGLTWLDIEKNLELEKELTFANVLSVRSHSLFLVKYHPDQEIDRRKAEILVDELYELVDSGLYLGLNDARGPNLEITKEARDVYEKNKSLDKTKAQAVIVNDLSTRIFLNFFVSINKPTTPVRLFNSFDRAFQWLISH